MDMSKAYQEQNKTLARAVNHLKMELRKSKHEVISLRHQLQLSNEHNVQLSEQQTSLFESIGKFENHLDRVFVNNSLNYVVLSTDIERITSKNPRRSFDRPIGTHNTSNSNDIHNSTFGIQSNIKTRHSMPATGKPQRRSLQQRNAELNDSIQVPHQMHRFVSDPMQDTTESGDILNTTFLVDSDNVFDNPTIPQSSACSSNKLSKAVNIDQKLIKKPSRLPVAKQRTKNLKRHAIDESINDVGQICTPSRRRCSSKLIDYRELAINRKMRRSK